MSHEDLSSHEELERRILEFAIDKNASRNPQIRMKARFSRDVFVPILNWVHGEVKRSTAMPDREVAHEHIANMAMTLASGLGLAFAGSLCSYVLSDDVVRNGLVAEALVRMLVEAIARDFPTTGSATK